VRPWHGYRRPRDHDAWPVAVRSRARCGLWGVCALPSVCVRVCLECVSTVVVCVVCLCVSVCGLDVLTAA